MPSPTKAQIVGLDPNISISQYNFTKWESSDGLPTNGVNGIAQSNNGYIWLATFNGLARFDGNAFEVYNQRNFPEISISTFRSVYQDPQQNMLWVTSHGNGLITIQGTKILRRYGLPEGLPSDVTHSVFRDSKGVLWAGTANGLAYLDGDKFKPWHGPKELENTTVTDIIEDVEQDLLYLATSTNGIYVIKDEKLFAHHNDNLSDLNVASLALDPKGNLWVGSYHGLDIIHRSNKKNINNSSTNLLENTFIRKVFFDKHGSAWIGSTNGLYRFVDERIEYFDNKEQLSDHEVTNITQDSEGNLWVCTYRAGLYKLTQGKILTYSTDEGLLGDVVYGVTETADNKLLIATKKGLTIYSDSLFDPFTLNGKEFNEAVRSVIESRDRKYYLGTSNGLYVVDSTGDYSYYNTENGLSDNYIRPLLEDHLGNIWIGTTYGISILDTTGNFKYVGREDGLSNEFILSLFEDSQHRVWISTRSGLNIYENGEIREVQPKGGTLYGSFFLAYEDKEQTVWIGASQGLMRYKDDELKFISVKDGLPFNLAFQVLEDSRKEMWFTTNEGIYKLKKRDINNRFDNPSSEGLKYRFYNKEDGMKSESCTANAKAIVRKNGTFVVPTFRGIATFNPDSIQKSSISPVVMIKNVTVDGNVVEIKDGKCIIPPEGKRVVINYTGLTFATPGDVLFRYMLTDLDEGFQAAGNTHEASYMNLSPGSYDFWVLSTNEDGTGTNKGDSVTLVKLPFFYQTVTFKILAAAIFATAFFLIIYIRLKGVKKSEEELKRKVDEKTKELQEQKREILAQRESIEKQNKQLESKNEELIELNKEKNHLISVVAHDLKSPLNQINGLISVMRLDEESLSNDHTKYMDMISASAKRLNNMISKILDVNSIESKKANFKFSVVDAYEVAKEAIEPYVEPAKTKQITIISEKENKGDHFINVDPAIYAQVIDNLVSNGIKFSPPKRSVYINIYDNEEEEVVFSVKDEGPGINKEDQKKLFGKYQKLSARPTGGESSTGLGLSIVKMFVENMGGRVWCESEGNKGANFFVAFKKAEVQSNS
ncbi:two-component regulator propeller domain-containing protein [Flammeovirgaceae bacterium SG7u.132]|nr:two-component regulator propeller domain-containing protein [Flammeovirgaceae bacterium SG7u.132]